MKQLVIKGKKELNGEIKISGAKNSIVALIPAAILSDEGATLYNVPNISEVNNIENDFNDLDNNIPLNPPLYPNKIIPENIINSAKKLKLIILQSKYLTEGKEYIINAGGLLGSKRKAKDGITFFGDKSVRK